MSDHTASPAVVVTDNTAASRYEARLGDGDGTLHRVAVATYELRGGAIAFLHTVVPTALEGHGVASQLARVALDDARRRGLAVVPVCPFFAAYIRRHAQYRDLVPEALRDELLAARPLPDAERPDPTSRPIDGR